MRGILNISSSGVYICLRELISVSGMLISVNDMLISVIGFFTLRSRDVQRYAWGTEFVCLATHSSREPPRGAPGSRRKKSVSLHSPWASRGIQGMPGVLNWYDLQPIRAGGRPGAPRGAPGSRRKKNACPLIRLGLPGAFKVCLG